MDTGPRAKVVDQMLVALTSGDAAVVFEVLARCDPTHAEIAAAEALVALDDWFDFACWPWLATHDA